MVSVMPQHAAGGGMDPRHEFFHAPGDDEFWSESYYLDVIDGDVAVHARIGFYPNREAANVFAFVVDDGTIYRLRDDEVDLRDVYGLCVDTPDFYFELLPERVGRDWRLAFGGTADRCETPREAVDGTGETIELDGELVTRARHEPFRYSDGAVWHGGTEEDRYEVATEVEGSVTVDDRTIQFEGTGERDHSWGPREWTDGEWLWISGAFDDGSAYNHLSAWAPGHGPSEAPPVITNGFWFDGDAVHAIEDADVSASPPFGAETARGWLEDGAAPEVDLTLSWAEGSADVTAALQATTPVDWRDEDAGQWAMLNRGPARQKRDGSVDGRGFVENMTQLELD
jgi:hypothetical protein